MSKSQWAFRPAVLTRAIKAAEKAGKNVLGAEIDSVSGKIELRFQECGASATQREGNEWIRFDASSCASMIADRLWPAGTSI